MGWCYKLRLKGLPRVSIRGLHHLVSQMCYVGEIVRKLHARLDDTSLNSHTAHAYISREQSRIFHLGFSCIFWHYPVTKSPTLV
jgi:hypothetical protein